MIHSVIISPWRTYILYYTRLEELGGSSLQVLEKSFMASILALFEYNLNLNVSLSKKHNIKDYLEDKVGWQ